MQGRLSPIIGGKIQSFPWGNWENEFEVGSKANFSLIEWTLDQEKLNENPFMTSKGHSKISLLKKKYNMEIISVTGDCFMQKPFWKAKNQKTITSLQKEFLSVISSCNTNNVRNLVVPLVDNGSLNSKLEENCLISFMLENEEFFNSNNTRILFESDFSPNKLSRLICKLNQDTFGINYDMGNSAALGYNSHEELEAYGDRILNVHIKDRKFQGETIALGEGAVRFEEVFSLLRKYNYQGYFILQAARAKDGNHLKVLKNYREIIIEHVNNSGFGKTTNRQVI